ncbi:uncharacterized protein LOC116298682 [Actinia tenebrosa]|uniref:Uncharacterized protein LOC116298682 n=1 Tax=Actinia tenebrosa TaxID=6105 RepID=A0A6P8I3E0_ACTTE|nr:uncharacterized protein LOC116298682 [Actinia tenebrosa]XP_031563070.1 uncharacterized protein LOC116298682 [Actinia tenebrosa]
MSRVIIWIFCFLLLEFSADILEASAVPWYNEADHYWNMNQIFYGFSYDAPQRVGVEQWHAHVIGSEVTSSPPNLGIRMYESYSRINLGSHHNSCFVDVAFCSNGLSIAFWVKGNKGSKHQDLLVFGGPHRGISVVKTKDGILETNISSMKMNKTWMVSSLGKVLEPWAWHHVGITWNSSAGLSLYLNATRVVSNTSAVPLNETSPAPSWSMHVGRNKHADIAIDELVLWSHVVSNDTITKAFEYKTGITASNVGCGSRWIAHLQFCYLSFNTLTSWDTAHTSCQVHSSGLLSIVSAEEDDFIRNRMSGSTPCIHLGLTVRQEAFVWTDDSVWSFSRLGHQGNITVNDSNQCVYRNMTDSLWYTSDCQRMCGYVCKTYRAGVFSNAEFQCHANQLHKGMSGYRLSVVKVRSQVECAMECLIYGLGCLSYNYQRYDKGYSEQFDEHLCELNGSSNHVHLVDMDGYQYCERK